MRRPLPALKTAVGPPTQERPKVIFYFDIVCPYAYLASTQIEAVASRVGADIVWQPVLLGGILKALDSHPDQGPEARRQMTRLDLLRWAEHLGVPLRYPAEHPRRTVEAMRLVCWAPPAARPPLVHALYRAYWVEGEDISDIEVLARVATAVGLNGGSACIGLQSPAARLELHRSTEEALRAGVFGVPTFVVESHRGPQLFFGQDRLHFVEAALLMHPLAKKKPEHDPGKRQPTPQDILATANPVANLARRLTFFYDFSSPFSYLASTQIEDVARRHGAVINWHPILLGGLFRSIGTPLVPLQSYSEPKRRYIREDLLRWAHYYDQPFHWPSRFPMMTVTALRLALLAGPAIGPLSHELFRAYWVQDLDLNDPAVLEGALRRVGLDPALLQRVGDPEVKQKLLANTKAAERAGVFGAPSFLVEQHHGPPQLFFGQDRLHFVEKALQRGTGTTPEPQVIVRSSK
ncbi:MAG: 2-hydroxychromene-2-carboxylate isomerase [Myxococcales bacterium]|nr:2-hydroxychromene-2-carboxylate isomerase [Myxococcales bacterium]